jgi:putative oxygen-independent coproporphyrinogen III oxidase
MTSVLSERRRSVADLAPAFGIYVHIPFCATRCPYCDFNTYIGLEDLAPAYCSALIEEAETWAQRVLPPAGSIFFGGGTPTVVDPGEIGRTLERLCATLAVRGDAEITMEANPDDCTASGLRVLRGAGANRISIGAQSFDPAILSALGRRHSADRIGRAVGAAREAGFANLNLDLIFGTPGESLASWRGSLEAAIALGPEHLSCYALTIEPGTAFGADVAARRMAAPDDDDQAAKYELALDLLEAAGYEHYEISNWAKPGFAARHNLVYWTQGDYAGLGAGAHSHIRGQRWWNRKLPRHYIERPADARAGGERLSAGQRAEEWLQLRLRLVDGLPIAEAERRLGCVLDLGPVERAGLATREDGTLRLSRRGLLLHNEAVIALIALDKGEC